MFVIKKMGDKYLKNSIISFVLIVSTVLMPVAFIPIKTEAEGVSTYIAASSTLLGQLPLCQNKLKSSLNRLFTGKMGSLESVPTTEVDSTTPGNMGDIPDPMDTLGDSLSELPTAEEVPTSIQAPVAEDIKKTEKNSAETLKTVTETNANDTCLKSIGRVVIKMLLQKLTTETVSWINGGYEGSPLFIQDPGAFFRDIEKDQILKFTSEINDPVLYPFGKEFIKSTVSSFNNKFANNAQYSLNSVIQKNNPAYNATTFSADFSQGGWAAWDALTQNPANNPLGFALIASNEIGKRIEDTTSLASGSLQQSGGYLGVEKCADPQDVTKEEDSKAILEQAESKGPYEYRRCTGGFKLVTPGKMVADAATNTVNYPNNNLLKAEDLNDAVAAILDAMLSQFSSGVMSSNGFLGLTKSSDWVGASEGNIVLNTDNTEDYSSSSDFSGYQSSFLNKNPNFNIRTDLNQALIDEQRIFIDKIKEQNRQLKSTIPITKENNPSGFFTGNYGLIPTIYQLDYCIPGPHPGWENDSRNILNNGLALVTPETQSSIGDKRLDEITGAASTISGLALAAGGAYLGATIGSAVPIVGTIIGAAVGAAVGAIVGYVIKFVEDKDTMGKLKNYYAGVIAAYTGQSPFSKSHNPQANTLTSLQNVSEALNTILDRYAEIINQVFRPAVMIEVTAEANQKYNEIKSYLKMFSNNEGTIVTMVGVAEKLSGIKANIDKLNDQLANKTITNRAGEIAPLLSTTDSDGNIIMGQKDQYEENLKPWIASFGRLSGEMVTGDDIAIVDNRIKQIVDEKDYIYNNLLKGPNGCEQELAINPVGSDGNRLSWRVYDTKRAQYPGELLYDYNNWNN